MAISFIEVYSDFYRFYHDLHVILNSEPMCKHITSLYGLSTHIAGL